MLPRSESVELAGRAVRVIGLDDLIRIKRYLGRPKDRASLREQEGLS
ncbi:MAG: hypothetical protein HYU41_12475 [Candidatus Rokubacteria bacterium]|nr:hypothetical protein [Candidatus Rokubacteria bacterium]